MSTDTPTTRSQSEASATNRLALWREDLLRTVLAVAVPAGTVLVVIGSAVAYFKQDVAMGITNIAGLATLLCLRYLRGLTVGARGVGMLFILTGVGVSFLVNHIGAFSLPWLSAAPIVAALLLGRKTALLLTVLICAVVFPLGYVYGLPLEPVPLLPHPLLMWFMLGLNYLALSLILSLSVAVLLRRLDMAVDQANTSQHIMTQLALVDPLTGLPNRRALRDELQALASRPDCQSALMFIDVDNFKDVNDTYGHLKGDELLVRVARRLSTQVPKPSLVARMGGDEFVVLFHPAPADPTPVSAQALAKAEQLRAAMAQAFLLPDGQQIQTSISIGVSVQTCGLGSADDAMREADTAMYQAKGKGRNQVTLFEEFMHTALHQRMQLANDLAHALRTGGLTVAVQTQVNASNQITGAEMLARWTHPDLGAVSPSQFIPLAEQSGLIVPLGDWMLKQTCLLAVRLRELGHVFPLSVNISALQFRQPDFEARLHTILAEHGVPPDALMLEITESLTMTDEGDTIASMARLVARGFRFSMDDFGTGYSSLSYLKRLPLYELKIDRSFVDDLPDDANDVAIVRMILAMAATLGLKVVAEGVETRAQADFLLAHGCQSLQGYLFSRPAPADVWLGGLS